MKRANVCLIRARVAKGVSRQLAAAGENTLCSLFEHPGTAFATPWPARGSLVAGKRGPAVPPASTSLVRLGHVRGKACEERAQERVCTRDQYWQNQPNCKNPQVLVFWRKSELIEGFLKQPFGAGSIEPWIKLLLCRHAFPACTLQPDAILDRRR